MAQMAFCATKDAVAIGRRLAQKPDMKLTARLAPLVCVLAAGLMVTACGEATTTPSPSSPSSTTSSSQSSVLSTNTLWSLKSLVKQARRR